MKKEKIRSNLKAYLLVVFQFSSLFGIIFTGPLLASGFVLLSIQLFGVAFALWSIYTIKIGNFKILPVPVLNGKLVMSGPYKLIRHPMYTSILLFTLPELLNSFSIIRLLVFIVLIISLIFKIAYEERKLIEAFSDYNQYKIKTYKMIPFIY